MHHRYIVVLPALLAGLPGCQWIAVSTSAIGYPATSAGETANVVVAGYTAYGTLAEGGLEVVSLANPEERRVVGPPAGSESIDDVAFADRFLFTLDAREPGHLSVFAISDSSIPVLVSGPFEVQVGPFSGVSAGNGRVIVSGGTSSLALFQYDQQGQLSPEVAAIDLGRGQPEVLISPDGRTGFVSTHYLGPYFGVTTLEIGGDSGALVRRGDVELDTYGFTDGGAKPANFPIEAAFASGALLVAHASGLAVVSIDTLEHPRVLTVVDVGIEAVNVDVLGSLAAVVGSTPEPRLVLLDVTIPSQPIITQTVPLPEDSYATSVSVGPEHIAIAAHTRGLLIYHHNKWSLRPERN